MIPLEDLIREGVPPELWWDSRNQLVLCSDPSPRRCHDRHELWVEGYRITRRVVLLKAPRALEFAREVASSLFAREYPS